MDQILKQQQPCESTTSYWLCIWHAWLVYAPSACRIPSQKYSSSHETSSQPETSIAKWLVSWGRLDRNELCHETSSQPELLAIA